VNDPGRQLVEAAEAELDGIDPQVSERLPKAVAAVLRKLSDLMVEGGWEDGNEWPDPDDLTMLADDIEGGGE
jgi:hypothetical protein